MRTRRPGDQPVSVGLDFGTTSARVAFAWTQPDGIRKLEMVPFQPQDTFVDATVQMGGETGHEFRTVGALVRGPDGGFQPVVGGRAYAFRGRANAHFVALKQALYVISGTSVEQLRARDERNALALEALLADMQDEELKPELRRLVLAALRRIKKAVDDFARKNCRWPQGVVASVPSFWTEDSFRHVHDCYTELIDEVWGGDDDSPGAGKVTVSEISCFGHYLFTRREPDLDEYEARMERLRLYDSIAVIDSGGHTVSVESFRLLRDQRHWGRRPDESHPGSLPADAPMFWTLWEGYSELGGGECWEHLLVKALRPKVAHLPQHVQHHYLSQIRSRLTLPGADKQPGGRDRPWAGDLRLHPHLDDREQAPVVLEAAEMERAFLQAFTPTFEAFEAFLEDPAAGGEGSLIFLGGGSMRYPAVQRRLDELLRQHSGGAASLRTSRAEDGDSDDQGPRRAGAAGRAGDGPRKFDVELAVYSDMVDLMHPPLVVCSGAAIAGQYKSCTPLSFMHRGASIGIFIFPDAPMVPILHGYAVRGTADVVVPPHVTDTRPESPDPQVPAAPRRRRGKGQPWTRRKGTLASRAGGVAGDDSQAGKRPRVILACAPAGVPGTSLRSGPRWVPPSHLYHLEHIKGLSPGKYTVTMEMNYDSDRLSVLFEPSGDRELPTRRLFEVWFEVGCVGIRTAEIQGP